MLNVADHTFGKDMQRMSSHRLNEQVYTLLMVVDQNHHGDQKAAGHRDIQPTGFPAPTQPLQQEHPLLKTQLVKRRQKNEFFLSDSGLAARGEGDCGKAGRRGSDVVWPLASLRCSAPRTDGITKDYRAMLGSSACAFDCVSFPCWACLCACVCVFVHVQSFRWLDVHVNVCVSPLDSWRAKACWAVCHTSLTQESSNGV